MSDELIRQAKTAISGLLAEAKEKHGDVFHNTWNPDAHLELTLTVEEVRGLHAVMKFLEATFIPSSVSYRQGGVLCGLCGGEMQSSPGPNGCGDMWRCPKCDISSVIGTAEAKPDPMKRECLAWARDYGRNPTGHHPHCKHRAVPAEAKPAEQPTVSPENHFTRLWHTNCPGHGYPERNPTSGIMRRIGKWVDTEAGGRESPWECLHCGVKVFAGIDASSRIVCRVAPTRAATGEGGAK